MVFQPTSTSKFSSEIFNNFFSAKRSTKKNQDLLRKSNNIIINKFYSTSITGTIEPSTLHGQLMLYQDLKHNVAFAAELPKRFLSGTKIFLYKNKTTTAIRLWLIVDWLSEFVFFGAPSEFIRQMLIFKLFQTSHQLWKKVDKVAKRFFRI